MKAHLKKLATQIAKKVPHAAAALRPPADNAALSRLDAHFGGAAPSDLRAWYAWHDGEVSGPGVGFDPNSTFFAIPLDEGLRLSREVLDPAHGFPLLSNGGGAWVCHRDGALVQVHHGEVIPWAPSLEAWVTAVTAALSEVKVSRIPPPASAYTFAPVDPVPTDFAAARALVNAATPGTVYLTETPVIGAPGHTWALYVRTAPNEWLAPMAQSGADRAAALALIHAQWRGFATKAPGKNSGYLVNDESMLFTLIPRPGSTLLSGTTAR